MRERYARAGLLGDDAAEGTLEGVVVAVSSPVALAGDSSPTYQVSVIVRATLKKGDRVLREATASWTENFTSGADVLLTEANRRAAPRRLIEGLARNVVKQLAAPARQ